MEKGKHARMISFLANLLIVRWLLENLSKMDAGFSFRPTKIERRRRWGQRGGVRWL